MNQKWDEVYQSESAHDKADILQTLLLQNFNKNFPEKTRKVSTDDQPWISHKIEKTRPKKKEGISQAQKEWKVAKVK